MGVGLALFVEVLAGALTGGGADHSDNPSADRPISNLLSILLDPERMAGAAARAADLERLLAYVTASPPPPSAARCCYRARSSAAPKLSELRTASRSTSNTLDQLRGAARSVGLADAEIARAIVPTEATRQS